MSRVSIKPKYWLGETYVEVDFFQTDVFLSTSVSYGRFERSFSPILATHMSWLCYGEIGSGARYRRLRVRGDRVAAKVRTPNNGRQRILIYPLGHWWDLRNRSWLDRFETIVCFQSSRLIINYVSIMIYSVTLCSWLKQDQSSRLGKIHGHTMAFIVQTPDIWSSLAHVHTRDIHPWTVKPIWRWFSVWFMQPWCFCIPQR